MHEANPPVLLLVTKVLHQEVHSCIAHPITLLDRYETNGCAISRIRTKNVGGLGGGRVRKA